MTDPREHHFYEEFIFTKLIENDRSKSEFRSWLLHNERYRVDILTRSLMRHDVKKVERKGKWKSVQVFALRLRRVSCGLRDAACIALLRSILFLVRQLTHLTKGKNRLILSFVEHHCIRSLI